MVNYPRLKQNFEELGGKDFAYHIDSTELGWHYRINLDPYYLVSRAKLLQPVH